MRGMTLKLRLQRLNARSASVIASLSRGIKTVILLAIDVATIPLAYGLACFLETGTLFDRPIVVLVMSLVGGAASLFLGLPRIKLLTFEQAGTQRVAIYGVATGLTGVLVAPIISSEGSGDPLMMLTITMAIIVLAVSGRLIIRWMLVKIYTSGMKRQRILIYGAGQTGVQLAAALDTDDAVDPVAFIDDNQTLQKILVAGRPVYSPVGIKQIIERENIQRIVLAMPSHGRAKQARLARHLQSFGCQISTLPSFASIIGGSSITDYLHPVDPATFLGRAELEPVANGDEIYAGSSIMITGAGGSIGSELARQVLACRPSTLVLFEISEHALYQLTRELSGALDVENECRIVPILGSVCDAALIRRTMEENCVTTVLHAAAYKHVTMVEKNRLPSIYNNVVGTRIAAREACAAGVTNFILVSTDKAVHPTNTMGASKRLAELLIQDLSTRSDDTQFSIVRFGNVLGSSGSVVPLFEEQIARGGPVTLTHTEVTRYFMTISEASRLVLVVGSLAQRTNRTGQVYLLDMGDPVLISDLARQMIKAAGYTVRDAANPEGDIEIQVIGLRPGEKLREVLAMDGHTVTQTSHPKIKSVDETRLSELEIASVMKALTAAIEVGDEAEALKLLERCTGMEPLRFQSNLSHGKNQTLI